LGSKYGDFRGEALTVCRCESTDSVTPATY
jgi:hypothetical protein